MAFWMAYNELLFMVLSGVLMREVVKPGPLKELSYTKDRVCYSKMFFFSRRTPFIDVLGSSYINGLCWR